MKSLLFTAIRKKKGLEATVISFTTRNSKGVPQEGESRGETCGLHNFEPGFPSRKSLIKINPTFLQRKFIKILFADKLKHSFTQKVAKSIAQRPAVNSNMKSTKKNLLLLCLSFMVVNFAACAPKPESGGNNSPELDNLQASGDGKNTSRENTSPYNIDGMFSSHDMDASYDESAAVLISLSDSAVEANSDSVTISGSTVTIGDEGSYLVRGDLSNGQIIVDAEKTDKVQLILDSVSINSNTSAPLYVRQADKVFISLADNSQNVLSTRDDFIAIDDNKIDAVLFSQEDLTLNGQGSLTLTTKDGNGIVSKDDLVFTGGNYKITSTGHGLEANDRVKIAGGTFSIMAGKDGIHSENEDDALLGFIYIENGNFDIEAEGDGFDASGTLQINDGNFAILTGGGSQNPIAETDDSPSTKAIKADGEVAIYGGIFTLDAFDDGIHSNTDVHIVGGDVTISSGDDGIHADASLRITDGNITILDSKEGIEGLTVDIMGGTIDVSAYDDGINAAGGTGAPGEKCYIHISGGTIAIHSTGVFENNDATGGDAIDANGDFTVTGGAIYISGTVSPRDAALDFDDTGTITGGILVAAGESSMAQNFDNTSTQGSILVSSRSMQTGAIKLQDSKGKELFSFTPKNEYNSVVISTPDIKIDETYTIIMGSESQTIEMENIIFGESRRRGRR